MKRRIALVIATISLFSCQQQAPVEVLATTSVMADAARQILPEEIQVVALMQSNMTRIPTSQWRAMWPS